MLKTQYTRQLVKRTITSGVTPTLKTGSTDHTDGTWTINEIYPGEFFYNMADNILYIGYDDESGFSGVTALTGASSSQTLAQTLANGNTTGGNDIQLSDGDTILGLSGGSIDLNFGATNEVLISKNSDNIYLTDDYLEFQVFNGEINNQCEDYLVDTTNQSHTLSQKEILLKAESITGNAETSITLLRSISADTAILNLEVVTGGTTHRILIDPSGQIDETKIELTDGTNISDIRFRTSQIISTVNDGTTTISNDMDCSIPGMTQTITDGVDTAQIVLDTQSYLINFPSTNDSTLQFYSNGDVDLNATSILKLQADPSGNQTKIEMDANSLRISVLGAGILNIDGLPSFDDDTDAGNSGLTTGDVYQTTGNGTNPLDVAGILMIKQ